MLDAKGRLTVPARWRDDLIARDGGRLIVTKSRAGCLSLFPPPVWEGFVTMLMGLPAEHEGVRRFFVGSATEVEIDSGSRVLVPPELRSWAGLEKSVKFAGVGAYFELWDHARYAANEGASIHAESPEALRNYVFT